MCQVCKKEVHRNHADRRFQQGTENLEVKETIGQQGSNNPASKDRMALHC